MQSVAIKPIMLSVVILNVVMLSVVALGSQRCLCLRCVVYHKHQLFALQFIYLSAVTAACMDATPMQ